MRTPFLIFLLIFFGACKENTGKSSTQQIPPPSPTLPVTNQVDSSLAGSWVLAGLPQATTPFETLYPRQRPVIFIQSDLQLISGSTGCNRFSATIATIGDKLTFTDFTSSTLKCIGEAEPNFLKGWQETKKYRFENPDEMLWGTDSVVWMVFKRR
jgi:heat shock protein HslJ